MAKRANGEGTIRKKPNGSWEARLSFEDGRKSVTGRTQAEAKAKLNELKKERDLGFNLSFNNMLLSEWLSIWMKDYRISIKNSTKSSYKAMINNHLIPCIGWKKLSKLKGEDVQKMYNQLYMDGLSPKTIKNIHGILHKAMEQALSLGYLVKNPCNACELPRIKKADIRPIGSDQLKTFCEAIKGDEYEELFLVALFTGLRQSELIGLTWDCVNFHTGWLRVYRQLHIDTYEHKGRYVFTDLKNGKERSFVPIPAVLNILKKIKQRQEEQKVKCGGLWNNENNLVFTNNYGSNRSSTTVSHHFKNIVKSIGLNEMRFHDLRHSFATLSMEAESDLKTISQTMGHYSVSFTMDVYGHVTDRMQRENALKLQNKVATFLP